LVPDNISRLKNLAEAGALGFKAFLIDSGVDEFPHVDERILTRAMNKIARLGVPLLLHAELDTNRNEENKTHHSLADDYPSYLSSRPDCWETDAVLLVENLIRKYGCRSHVVHLSSQHAISPLRGAKKSGLPITAETCPHYLMFASEEIKRDLSLFKCAPPIRGRENRDALWEALREGVIDMVVSDHSPCVPRLKEGGIMKAWGGISGLQFSLAVLWTEARARQCSLGQVARWMCEAPSRLAGLKSKGFLLPGFDADFVVLDPEEKFTVRAQTVHHRHATTCFLGRSLYGRVYSTWVRGQCVYDDGRFDSPIGCFLRRGE
jgi:allantoinase